MHREFSSKECVNISTEACMYSRFTSTRRDLMQVDLCRSWQPETERIKEHLSCKYVMEEMGLLLYKELKLKSNNPDNSLDIDEGRRLTTSHSVNDSNDGVPLRSQRERSATLTPTPQRITIAPSALCSPDTAADTEFDDIKKLKQVIQSIEHDSEATPRSHLRETAKIRLDFSLRLSATRF
ncbi:hypothetical protein B0F90DRAFT_306512 [Multifurca ochricompacta]|uniref:Uncharacterized protein n=1 Tax=Multifurca ochricompacta TaxID=376703 RepID=A0AAD4QNT3_9AGAM|nr:hypothetical protein B0F90DRAFT_306512 [Multifurca ochricompacta]